jgi:hypothetical protein
MYEDFVKQTIVEKVCFLAMVRLKIVNKLTFLCVGLTRNARHPKVDLEARETLSSLRSNF